MKQFKITWLSLITLAVFAVSCKKQENQVFVTGGEAPVVTASTAAVVLAAGKEAEQAIKFTWTNPNYEFTTGINSLDVSYKLELDTVGGNFNSSNKYVTVIPRDLSKEYTVAELNGILGNVMLLTYGRQYNMEARVTSSLASDAVPLPSNVVRFTATPFAPPPKVQLPATGELYIVGDATPGGWNNPVPVPSQKFNKISNTKYEITVTLIPSKFYLLLPENGSWAAKYCVENNGLPGISGGGDFVYKTSGGADIPSPADAGTYKITADFQTGKFTAVKQ